MRRQAPRTKVLSAHGLTRHAPAERWQQLGVVPNLMNLVGQSPAALEGYLSLNGALAKGKLDVKLRESIALAMRFLYRARGIGLLPMSISTRPYSVAERR